MPANGVYVMICPINRIGFFMPDHLFDDYSLFGSWSKRGQEKGQARQEAVKANLFGLCMFAVGGSWHQLEIHLPNCGFGCMLNPICGVIP
jgi:hypothetical protein